MIGGRFRFWPGSPKEVVCENNVVDQGEESFLKMIARADVSEVASGGNFYVGLMGSVFAETNTLATLIGEPTAAGGYARKPVARNSTGWPTIGEVNGVWRIATLTVNFAAAGADFSASILRAFLCNVVSGSAGRLFSVSGALPSAFLVTNGLTLPVQYELYLR